MMNSNPYLKRYQKNSVETATREDLFLILFNALLKFISKAKEALVSKDIEQIHNNIIKAQNILYEFIRTLDFSANPDLAENLKNLYQYNINLLFKANIKKDMKALEESYNLLFDLRETWKQVIESYKSSQAEQYQDTDQQDISVSQSNQNSDDTEDFNHNYEI